MPFFDQQPNGCSILIEFELNDEAMQTESVSDCSQAASNETLEKIDDEPMHIDPDSDFPHATPNKMIESIVT